MAKLMMMAGGIVEPGGGRPGVVSAYVALSSRGEATRLFKVKGPANNVTIRELPGATTVDLGRFQMELSRDLEPSLNELRLRGAAAGLSTPSSAWVCGLVKAHLKQTEGIEVDS
jgi:hypothetical protein